MYPSAASATTPVTAYVTVAIGVMALAFTVGSFWWMNARRGRLRTFEPTTWAGVINRDHAIVLLPLVFHNPGAVATVVTQMRLRFPGDDTRMTWEWVRDGLRLEDSKFEARSAFVVPARGTAEVIAEFHGSAMPDVVPDLRTYSVVIEVVTSASEDWTALMTTEIHFENFMDPTAYLVRSNDPDYLGDDAMERTRAKHAKLRKEMGLDPTGG